MHVAADGAHPSDGLLARVEPRTLLRSRLEGQRIDVGFGRQRRPFWLELEMPQVREQLLLEIAEAVESGQIRGWWQYAELLEDYDAHEGVQEGLECSEECLDDEDEDGNLTPKNADTDLVDEHVPEASPAIDADPGETASKQISSENSPDHMQALLAMREQAKDL